MTTRQPTPQLGWTRNHKLTVNGHRVRSVTWYDGWVSLAAGGSTFQVDIVEFERFVSPEWDPRKSWYYVSR